MSLRRGFKSESNWYARDVRIDLGLEPYDALCPWSLAERLDYDVFGISAYEGSNPKEAAFLQSAAGRKQFSAITILAKPSFVIVHNDSHTRARQAANIAHELAHGLLHHKAQTLSDDHTSRHFDAVQEEEAHWLGPALLVSEEAALFVIRKNLPLDVACEIYGVSAELMQMRIRVTGAAIRVARHDA